MDRETVGTAVGFVGLMLLATWWAIPAIVVMVVGGLSGPSA